MRAVAAALVAAVIGLTVFEVFGFMGIIGVKFSALPAVSLVMSVRHCVFLRIKPRRVYPTCSYFVVCLCV